MKAPVPPAKVFGALLARDLRVMRREIVSFLVRTTLQPLLFVVVFGYLLPKMGFVQRGYGAALLPGILGISLALSSLQAVALPMISDFGRTGEIEDRLLAPVPIRLVAAEKVVAGVIQGLVAALFVLPVARLIMGPIEALSLTHAGTLLGVTLLGSLAFSTLGLWMGTGIPPQQIGLMFGVIVAPMIFLGCAYYPWQGLTPLPVVKYAVLVNPLVFVAEGLRGALTPALPHMPWLLVLAALLVMSGVLWSFGMRAFERRAVS